jgi:hypothetical protein
MKFRISDYAYTITGGVFIGVSLFGALFLDWGREDYAFALLLFLIVSLGIRLDEISKHLGTEHKNPVDNRGADDRLLTSIREMSAELTRIRERLDAQSEAEKPDRTGPS